MKVIIIGGGFYGTAISLYLRNFDFIKSITIYEKESNIISRASFINQARIHNGYHYPRSLSTGYRTHKNFDKFLAEWSDCINSKIESYYAISRKNSKVTSKQFLRFCKEIGSPIQEANFDLKSLFNDYYIDNVFKVKEYVFNSKKIRKKVINDLTNNKISLILNSQVIKLENSNKNIIEATIKNKNNPQKKDYADLVFNCTYSGIGKLDNNFKENKIMLKHEITELVLIDIPKILENKCFTVMDGPFFSVLPFPSYKTSTISHVRYTPHKSWIESHDINPYNELKKYHKESRFKRIIKDSSKYLPSLYESEYKGSLFEIKTVLAKNEVDDGRPILFKEHNNIKNLYSILGAKIDNIFDIFLVIKKILNR